jgi:hypothetical protein
MSNRSLTSRFGALWDSLASAISRAPRPTQSLNPRQFQDTDVGSGIFGRWIIDRAGLPAYRYDFDQYRDNRARYPNSENIDRRDHWHQLGNDRVTALASNDGTMQVYLCDRGGVFLNRFEARGLESERGSSGLTDPIGRALGWLARVYLRLRVWWYQLEHHLPHQPVIEPRGASFAEPPHYPVPTERVYPPAPFAYSGGFAYLDDGTETWSTAFRYRPAQAQVERVFGMGYIDMTTTYRDLRVTRHVYAPPGDAPYLVIDVTLENRGDADRSVRYYEYWDVNVYQLKLQWLRTGLSAILGDDERYAINDHFTPNVGWYDHLRGLRFQQTLKGAPPTTEASPIDWAPADVFLADLNATDPAARFTRTHVFFGQGDAMQPDAVKLRLSGEADNIAALDHPMPYCLVLRHDRSIPAHQSITLRFAYGALRTDRDIASLNDQREPPPVTALSDHWRSQLAYFTTGQHPVLQREAAWHAYSLLASTVYSDYYGVHLVPQGSAYLYLHGADGAPRDQGLFVLPLTYLRPALARETLQLIMHLTHADTGEIPYAFAGYGIHDGASVHEHPSDLDLYFLLGLCEYLSATGDLAFLDSEESYYPRGSRSGSVLDHVRTAVAHLLHTVGLGPHGLLRVSDGDWSDSIVLETALKNLSTISYENTCARGESIPNTQMALYVLPRTAELIEARDPELALQLRRFTQVLKDNVKVMWRDRGWFVRAVLRSHEDEAVYWKADEIDLEAQPWALISGLAAEMQVEDQLLDAIGNYLDRPSPIGATLTPRGMVWPAISQLLTWGYVHCRPDLAWRSIQRHTYAEHARAFPEVWFNIWSGPDGVNSSDGRTWLSPLTPMTDFPVMNANQDALALLSLLRVCGIEPHPSSDGLIIAPQSPPDYFALDLPLLRLDVEPGCIAGEYRAQVTGQRVLHVRVPRGATQISASVKDELGTTAITTDNEVVLHLSFKASRSVPFEVRWQI